MSRSLKTERAHQVLLLDASCKSACSHKMRAANVLTRQDFCGLPIIDTVMERSSGQIDNPSGSIDNNLLIQIAGGNVKLSCKYIEVQNVYRAPAQHQ